MKQRPRIYYTESQKAIMWGGGGKASPSSVSPNCLIATTHRYNGYWQRQVGYNRRSDAVRDWR